MRAWIRRSVGSYFHPAGTCRMGTGPGAVTDPQLRVHGITGLRVADASVMPVIPNAPPHATVLAIAEKAADLIAPRLLTPAPVTGKATPMHTSPARSANIRQVGRDGTTSSSSPWTPGTGRPGSSWPSGSART